MKSRIDLGRCCCEEPPLDGTDCNCPDGISEHYVVHLPGTSPASGDYIVDFVSSPPCLWRYENLSDPGGGTCQVRVMELTMTASPPDKVTFVVTVTFYDYGVGEDSFITGNEYVLFNVDGPVDCMASRSLPILLNGVLTTCSGIGSGNATIAAV